MSPVSSISNNRERILQKFKSKIRSLLFDILETGDTYYDLDEIIFLNEEKNILFQSLLNGRKLN